MKKAILILSVLLVALAAPIARAETTYTVVLAGGAVQNSIRIWPSPDGHSYVIDSAVPLEVGGTVCENASGNPNELICKAPLVAGFEINGGEGDDSVSVANSIELPVTMRGGSGSDTLIGGNGPDKLIGGPGADELFGGAGNDVLRGGHLDSFYGGPGRNTLIRGGVILPSGKRLAL
jgi:Ca2+-binding RTX toxin-like protein